VTQLERLVAERVARATTRRRFLRRTTEATFVGLSSWLALGRFGPEAIAHTKNGAGHCANLSGIYACNFPNGLCSGCNGHGCPAGYAWYTGTYNSACWCTKQSFGNYNICCDCRRKTSPFNVCGCRTFVSAGAVEPA
jgi:hypothetical protein